MSECPSCGDPLAHGVCGSCGFGRGSTAKQAIRDPLRNRCAWIADGERCRYIGGFSHDTHGDGPFYCRDHSSGLAVKDKAARVQESMTAVSNGFDWSSEACVSRVRRAFELAE